MLSTAAHIRRGRTAQHVCNRSRNIIAPQLSCVSLLHSSPRLRKPRSGKYASKSIQINAFDEELFPNRRSQIKYANELAMKDKIRSARIARRQKLHEIYTLKFAQLMFEVLQDTLHRNELKPAIIKWKDIGHVPGYLSDIENENTNTNTTANELTILEKMENLVQLNLRDVGFDINAVTMPNHRQYCVVWWQYNSICKFPAGIHVCKHVLELYKDTLRAVLARKVNLKRTPRLIFKLSEDPQMQALEYKAKMNELLEIAVLNSVQSDFETQDETQQTQLKYNNVNKNSIGIDTEYKEFVNQSTFDTILDFHYGDYQHSTHAQPHNHNANERNHKNKNKGNNRYKHWMDIYTKRIFGTKLEDKEKADRRRMKQNEKKREKSHILNMILSADPTAQNIIRSSGHHIKTEHNNNIDNDSKTMVIQNDRRRRDVVLNEDSIVYESGDPSASSSHQPSFARNRRRNPTKNKNMTHSRSNNNVNQQLVVGHNHDMDLIGLVH